MHFVGLRHPGVVIHQWRNLIDRGTCSAVLVAESRIDDFEHAGGQQIVYGTLGGAPRCAVETIADVVPPLTLSGSACGTFRRWRSARGIRVLIARACGKSVMLRRL